MELAYGSEDCISRHLIGTMMHSCYFVPGYYGCLFGAVYTHRRLRRFLLF